MINYLDDLFTVRDILSKEKTVLLPTDADWCLVCDAYSHKAVSNLRHLSENSQLDCFVIAESMDFIKNNVNQLHPRIETLLVYHEKPLNVIYKAKSHLPTFLTENGGLVTIRLTRNALLSDLIKLLSSPLYACTVKLENLKAVNLKEMIPRQFRNAAEYTFDFGYKNEENNMAAVLVSFDETGELFFHRE